MRPDQRTMSLAKLFREFRNGDCTDWDSERRWIEENHPHHLASLRRSIAREGITEPIRLCYDERRVVDGHHRLIAAADLGLRRVPVANAWEDDDWWRYANDPFPPEHLAAAESGGAAGTGEGGGGE